jgi:TP901 family phage tail tape measure protein|nr:MAG TPA: minor tail protein [Caudoviricetes sp.]
MQKREEVLHLEVFKLLGTIALTGVEETNKDIDKTKQNGEKLATQFNKAADEVAQFGIKIATTVASAATAIGTLAIKSAADFETSFAKVSTLLDTNALDVEAYKKRIMQVSSEMNVSTDELCESIYQAISASVDQADAIDFATKAMKLAKGGFTDTATAVDIMTTAINAYGMSAADAESISDKLIMTQNKGKTTVGDLAAAMGRVIPAANTFGVSLDELCGYYATMTANGIATAETTTYLNSMIKELGTGSDTLYTQLENATESVLGEKKSFQELRAEGYTVLDVIGILGQYSEQTGDSIIGMFSSSEGGMAAQVLANNIDGVTRNINAMKDSAGATEEAYKKMASTSAASFKKIQNQVKNMFTELGQKLMPTVNKLLDKTQKSLPKIQKQVDKLQPTIEKWLNKIEPVLDWLIDKALPGAVKMLSFCVENFDKLAISIGITVAALKTMAIVGTVTEALKKSATAMGAFNAIMTANPIGMVVTALGALAIAIGAAAVASKTATDITAESVKKTHEETEAILENNKALRDQQKAIDEKAESGLVEVANTERLWKELQTLCDEEGNVTDANKARAEFILNELNEALGAEYTMTGNQIDNYNELTESVYNTIESKKAEILLSAKEEKYKNALLNLTEQEETAYKKKRELIEQQNAVSEKELEYEEAKKAASEVSIDATYAEMQAIDQKVETAKAAYDAEVEKLQDKQIAYDDTKDKIFEYYDDISAYENASTLILQGNVTEAIDYMDKLGMSYKSAADVAGESAEKQKETLEQQKNDAQDYYVLLRSYYNSATEEQKKSIETRLEDAKEYAKKTAEEYAKVGSSAVLSYEDGVESKQNSLMEKMSDLSKLAVKSAKDESDTSSVGENMVDGISSGVDKKSGSLFTKIRSLIKKSIFAAKDEADIHSPSRVFAKKVGAFIPSGIAKGIEDNEEDATKPIENLIDKMVVSGSNSVNTNNYRHNPAPTINASFSTAAIIDKLNQLMDMIASRGNDKIYLNGDVLVGELAPAMDSALGDISAASRRGQ